MRTAKYVILAGALGLGGLQYAEAQLEVGDAGDACGQIESLRKAGKLPDARDMARACLDALEQEVNGAASKFFLPEVAGWKRTNVDQNQALGFTNVSATYTKGEHEASVALTGGSGDGGLGSVLGGFAKLGLKAAGKQVKVGGLPASVQPDGTITVSLEDGSLLMFSSADFHNPDEALAGLGDLVNAFPVADINKALK